MSLHDDLQKKLNAEQMQQLDDLLGDDFDWDLVPRSRLNKVISQRNELRKQVGTQGSTAATTTKKTSKKAEVDDDDDDNLTYTKDELEALLQAEREKSQAEVNAFKVKQATLSKLQTEKALDPELVFGLLDSSKLSLNEKGELQGLDDAGFKAIKEGKKFLFGESDPQPNVPSGTGKEGQGKGGKGGDAVDAALADVFAGYTFIESDTN